VDATKAKFIFITTAAACFALYLGIAAATAQLEAIAWVAGISALVFLLALGRHVWALVPVFAVLGGTLSFVPGYPSPWYAVTPIVTLMLLSRFLMRSKNFRFRFCWMDACLLLQIFVLGQAFMRNPTGLAILGNSDVIGGRPYVDYCMAIFSYFLLATTRTDLSVVRRVIICMITLSLCDELVKGATGFSGTLSRIVGSFYTNVDYAANEAGAAYSFDIATTRFSSLAGLGVVISQVLFSFNRPLLCLLPLNPLRFMTLVLAIAVTLLSGFRSGLIKIACYFVTGTLIRRKPMDLLIGGAFGVLLLAMLIATTGLTALPQAAQRTLSFLPLKVDEGVRESAEGSADWRFEMWRLVLTTDRYIQNKWLGDGFGFSAAELEAQLLSTIKQGSYRGDSIDMFIAKGSYHGWHVEAIRFTGVLGLIIGLVILFSFARVAWILIRHYRGSSFEPFSVYLCIPFLVEPFFTLFVFGSYKGTFINYIAMSGILRVVYGLYLEETVAMRASAKALTEGEPLSAGPGSLLNLPSRG
jgi:hypothetical protein